MIFNYELQTIAADAGRAARKAADRDTRLHLEDLRDEISKILDPKFQQSNSAPGGPGPVTGIETDDEFCWPDYAVK